jgi:hypothetical protein
VDEVPTCHPPRLFLKGADPIVVGGWGSAKILMLRGLEEPDGRVEKDSGVEDGCGRPVNSTMLAHKYGTS